YGGEHVPEREDGDRPEPEQRPRGMQQRRQDERPAEEEGFPRERGEERPAARRRKLLAADAPGDELAWIVEEPPLQRAHAVQEPHVERLEAVVPSPRLPRREAQEGAAGLDVGIEPGDI